MEEKSKSRGETKKRTSHLILTAFWSLWNPVGVYEWRECETWWKGREVERRCGVFLFSEQFSTPLFLAFSVSHPSFTAALPLQPTPLSAHFQYLFIQLLTLIAPSCVVALKVVFVETSSSCSSDELAGVVRSYDDATHIIEAQSSKSFPLFNNGIRQLYKGSNLFSWKHLMLLSLVLFYYQP